MSVDLSFLSTKINSSVNYSEKSKYETNKVYVVLKATTEYGRIGIKNLKLTSEAAKTYKNNRDKFVEVYGTHFPVLMRHGSKVYVIVEIENVSSEFSSSLKSELSAKYSGITFSGSFKASLKKELKQSSDESRLNITVINNGGDGFDGIDQVITSIKKGEEVEEIKKSLGKYLTTHKFKNSAPIGYYMLPYQRTGLFNLPHPAEIERDESILTKIVSEYRNLELRSEQLENLLSVNSPAYYLVPDRVLNSISSSYLPKIRVRFKELEKMHRDCLSGNCSYSASTSLPLDSLLPNFFNIAVRFDLDSATKEFKSIQIRRNYIDHVSLVSNYYVVDPITGLPTFLEKADRPITSGSVLLKDIQQDIQLTPNILLTNKFIILKSTWFDTNNLNTYLRFTNAANNTGNNYVDVSLRVKNIFGTQKSFDIGRFYPSQNVAEKATSILYIKK